MVFVSWKNKKKIFISFIFVKYKSKSFLILKLSIKIKREKSLFVYAKFLNFQRSNISIYQTQTTIYIYSLNFETAPIQSSFTPSLYNKIKYRYHVDILFTFLSKVFSFLLLLKEIEIFNKQTRHALNLKIRAKLN